MKLEGTLDAFSLPDIFALLSMTKKTGGLHLRRSTSHGAVWFADGMITGASPDLTRQSLARRLAGSPHVTDAALTAAVTQVRLDDEVGVARVLRDAEAIDEGALHALVTEQIMDAVFDLMRWNDGEFAFTVDEPNRDGVGVSCRVDDVVAEVRLRLDTWAKLDPAIADPNAVLTIAQDGAADTGLTAQEWALVALVDGRRTVAEIVSLRGCGDYAVVVSLADLAARGLVRPADEAGVAWLTRRQDLLSAIEAAAAPAAPAAPTPPPPAAVAPAAPAPVAPPPAPEPVAPAPEPPPPQLPVEPYTPEPAYSAPAYPAPAPVPAQPAPAAAVLPSYDDLPAAPAVEIAPLARPGAAASGPFTSGRQPNYSPEPVAAAAGGGAVASPSPIIERDPSVNKSLLLRLIAGVRGL